MRPFVSDLRYALRVLLKNPRFSLVAVAALALGIGANTAIFSVVNAVLLRPLAYPEPERLVQICRQFPNATACSTSIPKFMAWQRAAVFEAIAAYDFAGPGMNLGGGDRPEQVRGIRVSREYFRVFGARSVQGRTFSPEEDQPGGPAVAVLSERTWRMRFGADPRIVGRTIPINGDPRMVVGIIEAAFRTDPPLDVFLPLQADPASTNHGHYLAVSARLKRGMTLEHARAALAIAGREFRREHPRWMSTQESIAVDPLQERIVEDVRRALLVLLGAVGLVLLIACANVASLLLARAAGRQKEIAIRAAIGAGRADIVRQLLVESLLLAAMAAVVGLVIGVWGARALITISPGTLPRAGDLAAGSLVSSVLDWRLLGFTLLVATGTGLIFGLAPALHLSRADLGQTLKEGGGRGTSGGRSARARGALVIAEVALALVLLVGSVLLIRTFSALRAVDPGFNTQHVLTLQTSLAGEKYTTTRAVDRLTRDVTRGIDALPGVVASALAISLPTEDGPDLPFAIEGRAFRGDSRYHGNELYRSVSSGYFRALDIPLMRGRLFTERDTAGATPVVIINAAMGRIYWPNGDPIGQRLDIGRGLGPEFEDAPREVIGIVANVRESGLGQPEPGIMYVPVAQTPDGMTRLGNSVLPMSWVVRATSSPAALASAVQHTILAVDPLLPAARIRTMDAVVGESVARQSFNMLLLSIFGAIALLLAAVGIYGLMSYSVEQNTHDIGVRIALGAGRRDIFVMVVGRGMRLAAAGLAAGVAAAAGAVRLLAGMLYGVQPLDPLTFLTVSVTLATIALLASYVPARRALRVDPLVALRNE